MVEFTDRRINYRIAIVVVAVIFFFLLFGLIYLGVQNHYLSKKLNSLKAKSIEVRSNVCNSDYCREAAEDLRKSIDNKLSPCDNFYQFTCGNWIKNNQIQPHETSTGSSSIIYNKISIRLRELLSNKNTSNVGAVNKVRTYYQACMNTDKIDERGISTLRKLFADNKLTWPMLGINWNESLFDINEEIIKYTKLGLTALFEIKYSFNFFKSSENITYFSAEHHMISKDKSTYQSKSTMNSYRNYLINISSYLMPNSDITKDVDGIIWYEKEMSKFLYDPGKTPSIKQRVKLKKLSDMDTDFQSIFSPSTIIKAIFSQRHVNIPIKDADLIQVLDWGKFKQIVKFWSTVPKRTLANVLALSAFSEFIDFLPKEVREFKDIFAKERQNVNPLPRWKSCMDVMDDAIMRLYSDNYFPEQNLNVIDNEILNIGSHTSVLISLVSWMDKKTKKEALTKAEKMKFHVGFSRSILNDAQLNHKYRDYVMEKHKAFENYALHLKIHYVKLLTGETTFSPISHFKPNGAYYSLKNKITFNAAILHPPFFHGKALKSMNYGGIGQAIGHEISHAFDSAGRHFDSDGNMKNWWSKASEAEFVKRTKCVIYQYNNYTVKAVNKNVNGKLTITENIADLAGIKLAYMAYKASEFHDGNEGRTLPGLDFTSDQIFFINFARVYCSQVRPSLIKKRLNVERHSPSEFRVIGSLAGFKGFVDAFDCPLGSQMNPGKVCKVW